MISYREECLLFLVAWINKWTNDPQSLWIIWEARSLHLPACCGSGEKLLWWAEELPDPQVEQTASCPTERPERDWLDFLLPVVSPKQQKQFCFLLYASLLLQDRYQQSKFHVFQRNHEIMSQLIKNATHLRPLIYIKEEYQINI